MPKNGNVGCGVPVKGLPASHISVSEVGMESKCLHNSVVLVRWVVYNKHTSRAEEPRKGTVIAMKQAKEFVYYDDYPAYSTVRTMLCDTAARFADKIAYSYRLRSMDREACTVTYSAFLKEIRQIGTAALARGMAGAHVALIGRLSYAWVCTYFAMLSIGAVLVPLDRDWTAEELRETVATAECTFLFCDNELAASDFGISREKTVLLNGEEENGLRALAQVGQTMLEAGNTAFDCAPIASDALAMLVFTSGTTGKGKGVMLSQRALLSDLRGAMSILRVPVKTIAVLPPHHTYGSTVGLLGTFYCGCHTYLSGGVRYLAREMMTEKPEILVLVPLYLETFRKKIWSAAAASGREQTLRRAIRLSEGLRRVGIDRRRAFFGESVIAAFGGALQKVICGGAPLDSAVVAEFDAIGIEVLNGYGITECAPMVSVNRNADRSGSVGYPFPGEEVKIENPNEDGEGEICVRGPQVMLGYWKNEEETAQVFDDDGFFHTGDIGVLRDGKLYITGRTKNLIILSNGKNVYPEEIEASLASIPGTGDVVVYEGISRSHPDSDVIVAEFYPDPEVFGQSSKEEIYAHFSSHVAAYNRHAVPYKKVGHVRVRHEEFPKNTLRKITRFRIDRTID